MTVIGADDVCGEVMEYVKTHLAAYAKRYGLKPPVVWASLPSPETLSSARYPAVTVSSPGIVGTPEQFANGYMATWAVEVGGWVRPGVPGQPGFTETTRQTRAFAKAIRECVLSQGGINWVNETYDTVSDTGQAGTMGLALVSFEITRTDAVDSAEVFPPGEPLPVVTQTFVNVIPKE